MKHNCFFWYSADYTSLYIDPVKTSMELPIFNEKITGADLIIPNDTEKLPAIFPQGSERIENTPYKRFLGHSYRSFLMMPRDKPIKDIYEYSFNLENGMVVSNLGQGVLIENTTVADINLCLFKIFGTMIQVHVWQPERFYQIIDGIIRPTEHVTSDPVEHICGLNMPEIFE